MWSCDVPSSLVVVQTHRFCRHCKFTLPLVIPRVYVVPHCRYHTAASFPLVSLTERRVLDIPHPHVDLWSCLLYHLYLNILTGKTLNINLPVFFWVKCKMKYSTTSQGCTSAGFYGNCRAVFSAVVSLCLALRFQPGEGGRVRTIPKGPKQKVGQHLLSPSNKIFQLERRSCQEFLTLFERETMHREGTQNPNYKRQKW